METHNIIVIHYYNKEHINNNFLRHEYEPQRLKSFMHLKIQPDIILSCPFSTQLTSKHYIHRNIHRARKLSTVTSSQNNKIIVVCSILFIFLNYREWGDIAQVQFLMASECGGANRIPAFLGGKFELNRMLTSELIRSCLTQMKSNSDVVSKSELLRP